MARAKKKVYTATLVKDIRNNVSLNSTISQLVWFDKVIPHVFEATRCGNKPGANVYYRITKNCKERLKKLFDEQNIYCLRDYEPLIKINEKYLDVQIDFDLKELCI